MLQELVKNAVEANSITLLTIQTVCNLFIVRMNRYNFVFYFYNFLRPMLAQTADAVKTKLYLSCLPIALISHFLYLISIALKILLCKKLERIYIIVQKRL